MTSEITYGTLSTGYKISIYKRKNQRRGLDGMKGRIHEIFY